MIQKVWSLADRQQYEEISQLLTEEVLTAHNDATLYYESAVAQEEGGHHNQAMRDYNKAIQLNPDLAEVYYGKGEVWYNQNDYVRAVEQYSLFIKMKPYDVLGYNSRGYAFWALKEWDKAIDDFTINIGLTPASPAEYFVRGRIRHEKLEANRSGKKEDFENAIRDFDDAIRLDPENAEAYHYRAVMHSSLENYEQALKDLEKAIQLNPNIEAFHLQVEMTLAKMKRTGVIGDDEKAAIRMQVVSFLDQLRKKLDEKFKKAKEEYAHGWAIEAWDKVNKRPLAAGIQGWLPEIRPDLAKWQMGKNSKGEKAMITVTHDGQEFWPSLAGIPIRKGLWVAIVGFKQFRIGEKQLNANVRRFPMVNLLLMRIITRVRKGDLDAELVFGEYKVPSAMEEFESALRRTLGPLGNDPEMIR